MEEHVFRPKNVIKKNLAKEQCPNAQVLFVEVSPCTRF